VLGLKRTQGLPPLRDGVVGPWMPQLIAQRGRAEQGARAEGNLPRGQYDACVTCRGHYHDDATAPSLQYPEGKMTSEKPSSVAERRPAIARRLL
jgi:hypothetical protein